jgi:hypothetical protein
VAAEPAQRRVDADEDRTADAGVGHLLEVVHGRLRFAELETGDGEREMRRRRDRPGGVHQFEPLPPVGVPAPRPEGGAQLRRVEAQAPASLLADQADGFLVAPQPEPSIDH